MNLLKCFGLLCSVVSVTLATTESAYAETILNYEIPNADAIYLNICSMQYKLNSGFCSKINIQNQRIIGNVGTITIDDRVRKGDEAWVVFVADINNDPYRYLYCGRIRGGKVYNVGPGYCNKVPHGPY